MRGRSNTCNIRYYLTFRDFAFRLPTNQLPQHREEYKNGLEMEISGNLDDERKNEAMTYLSGKYLGQTPLSDSAL